MVKSRLIKNVVFPIADLYLGSSVAKSFHIIKKLHSLSKDELANWQNYKLQNIIQHAYNNTKYYNNLFKKIGIGPEQIKTINDLKLLPPLTKEIINSNKVNLIPTNIKSIPHKISSTGGSTGTPLVYYLSLDSWSMSIANNIINWEKTGYAYGNRFIALGSTSLYVEDKKSWKHRLYYSLKNMIGLNGINMSDETCDNYILLIKRKKIKYIYGYASSVYLLANYARKMNIILNIKVCFTTSEILTRIFRDTISEAFNCDIVDCYGAHDGGITAFSFTEGSFYVSYNSLININNKNENDIGTALITDLNNYAMPLINYQVGDEFIMADSHSSSYNGQIIKQVLGRSSDIICLENGSVITGPGFTVLFKDIPVEHYFIEKSGYNSVTCNIVKHSEYNKQHESIIYDTFKKHLGSESSFVIRYTKSIPLTGSGKRKYFGNQ